MTRFNMAALAAIILLATGTGAWAQNPAQIQNPATTAAIQKQQQERGQRVVPPPALPGSRAEPAAVAPAERSAADLPPTEALFDAINRGDLPTAKDAISRGADINGTNVLGLTPLELAVDLGRNEISFLLLSLRGGAGYNVTREPGESGPARPPSRAERMAALQAERAQRRQSQAVERVATPAAAQTARLFAGDGGAPVPQAGFLGFDAGR